MRTAVVLALALLMWTGFGVAGDVTVTYYGHSCFMIQAEGGPAIMIDPYGSYVPYPGLPAEADIVLITHPHIDHCPPCYGEYGRVQGEPGIFLAWDLNTGEVKEGDWKITDELSVRIVEVSRVNARGGGEGRVGVFRFEIDDIVFAHLGDLGKILEGPQMAALSDVEVLFVPVGRQFTLDAAEAMTVIAQLPDVRVVFPMH
ncbi:MAG: MBL fold metallo-hydrolase [Candidatus Bipolaricaulota bacterium]|nr:MAG: MBL fold metallo-hydrolase [Candidatus Bipolaricaulota bacterium]